MSEPHPPSRITDVRDAIGANPYVAMVDVENCRGITSIAAILYPDCERVPPSLCRIIGEHDMGVWDLGRVGNPTHIQVFVR